MFNIKRKLLKEIIMSIHLVIVTCYTFELIEINTSNIYFRISIILMLFYLIFIVSKLMTNKVLDILKLKEK